MTDTWLKNTTPDSITGIIFAFEGIKNAVTLLNGPTGCKFYHAAVSENQGKRAVEFELPFFPEQWYFEQPRVPCTYLDKRDYVYGSEDKLREAIEFISKNSSPELIAVVNSPGAALIGDDLERIVNSASPDCPVVTVESSGYSQQMKDGYTTAAVKLIGSLCEKREKRHEAENKRINLIGLSIFHKYYEGSIRELRRLFKLCGIEVNCVLFAGSTVEEIKRLPEAALNVVIDPVFGRETAEYLKKEFGMPYINTKSLPLGFAETEKMLRATADFLKADVGGAIKDAEIKRADCFIALQSVNNLTGLPKGTKFAVHGTSSECLGYCRFLTSYLGMVADVVSLTDNDPETKNLLSDFLTERGAEGALLKDIDETEADIVFADGNTIGRLRSKGHIFSGVETSMPGMGYIDIVPKTHLGNKGACLIVEQVLNGLIY